MSILHIILVKRLVSIVWDPKEARDDTEEYQNKEWSSQLWTQFLQLCKKPEKKKKKSGLQREIWKRAQDFYSRVSVAQW